jgi:hypothetical protein
LGDGVEIERHLHSDHGRQFLPHRGAACRQG